MKPHWTWVASLLMLAGCYRQDPLVRAAQDLREAAYDFARQDEERRQQFNLLELGMTENEVLKRLGPPSSRQSLGSDTEDNRQTWTYTRAMQPPVVLTFANRRLTEIRME